MEIVFSNPCFLGDILCTLGPIETWKKRTGAKITLICEDVYNSGEPRSILVNDPNIDELHILPFNTIPRGMNQPAEYIYPWVEQYLNRKVDKIYDLHKTWIGSLGKNWYNLSELSFDDYTKLTFYHPREWIEKNATFQIFKHQWQELISRF